MGLGSRRLKHIKGNELSSSPIFPVHPDGSIIAIFQEEYCEIMKILAWMKILGQLLAICNRSPIYCNVDKNIFFRFGQNGFDDGIPIKKSKKSFFRSNSSPIAMHWRPIVSSFCRICHDSFHKYLCVKVGGLVLVAEAGKIFLTRAFLEEIFAVSNFDALGSWGKHLCWAGDDAALLNVETIWNWKSKKMLR